MATETISLSPTSGAELCPRLNGLTIDDRADKIYESAIEEYSSHTRKNFELVKVGPVAVGTIGDGYVIHANFEGKRVDATDAIPQTFFAEFEVVNDNAILKFMRLLGATHSLPDKAEIRSCVYCIHKGIHHPKVPFYRTGREDLYPILLEKVKLMTEDANGMTEQYNEFDFDDRCAILALEKYNNEQGDCFEFVETDGVGCAACLAPGIIIHLNFVAKKKDDPKLIIFFAEALKFDKNSILVTFCKSLGPAELLPEEAELFGCEYSKDDDTHHPLCGGYLTGREKYNFDE